MLNQLKRRLLGNSNIAVTPVKTGDGWLATTLPRSFNPAAVDVSPVRARAELTQRLGGRPLWKGYQDLEDYPYATSGDRTSEQVRTAEGIGAFYAWLAGKRRPEVIVEFGTAFGVSGMFWLTGLQIANGGVLMTYEPNEAWADIAEGNLRSISDRFALTKGTFEENAAATLAERSVDIALIDAIHTSDFVYAQYAKLGPYLKRDALVFFDDIDFSPNMRECWQDIAHRPEVAASVELGTRVGLIELRQP